MGLSQRKEQRKVLIKMSSSKLKSIGQAIIDGDLKFKPWLTKFSPEIFEVSFSNIIAGRGHDTYLNPEKFYENTQMTQRMRDVLLWCLARTASLNDKGTIYLATGFGGGKSHLLTLLYHTFKSREIIDHQYLAELSLNEIQDVKIVAIDGHNLTYPMSENNDLKDYILPTKELTLKAIEGEGRPIVFLIDELVVYLAKQNHEKQSSEMANLHTLMMAINSSRNSVMVITNPKGAQVYGKEVETLDALVAKTRQQDTAQHLSTLLGRVTQPIVPVQKEDFISIMRKRLVEYINTETAKEVETYLNEKINMDFTGFYPFHPLLIDVFYDRISLFPDFQKTRDFLRVVALAIKGLINNMESAKFYVISPSDFLFDDADLRDILTNEKVFGSNLEQAVTQDVVKAARGADEGNIFDTYGRINSAVFMYSLHTETSKRGVTADTVFKCLTDARTVNDVEKYLSNFYNNYSTFMWDEESRYLFKSKQNVPNLINIRSERINTTLIRNHIKKTLYKDVFGDASTSYCTFYQPENYTPTPNRLNIVVPFYWDIIEDITSIRLSINAPKKNTNIVLIPDTNMASNVEFITRKIIATKQVQKIVKDDKAQFNETKRIHEEASARALAQFKGMYTEMRYLWGTDIKRIPLDPIKDQMINDVVIKCLKGAQKVVDIEYVDPKGYLETLLSRRESEQVRRLFPNIEDMATIPFASKNQLKTIIGNGVYEGVIGLLRGNLPPNDVFTGRETVILRPLRQDVIVNDGDTVLTFDYAEKIIRDIAKARGEDEPGGLPPPLFTCSECGRDFPTEKDLQQHIREKHVGDKEEEVETFVSDAGDLNRLLSDRWWPIVTDADIKVRIILQFSGAVRGTITAQNREEVSSLMDLTDGISKAKDRLNDVEFTITIYKTKGRDSKS